MDANYETEGHMANVIAITVGAISWGLLIAGSMGFGMPLHGKENTFGDLILHLNIILPKHLTEQEKELFTTLSTLRSHS